MLKQYAQGILGAAMLGISTNATSADSFNPTHEEMEAFFYGTTSCTPADNLTLIQEFNCHIREHYSPKQPVFLLDREQAGTGSIRAEIPDEEVIRQMTMFEAYQKNDSFTDTKEAFKEVYTPEDLQYAAKNLKDLRRPSASNRGDYCTIAPGYTPVDQEVRYYLYPQYNLKEIIHITPFSDEFTSRQGVNIHEYVHCEDVNSNYDTPYEIYLTESVADAGLAFEVIHKGGGVEEIESMMLTRSHETVATGTVNHFTTPTLQAVTELNFEDIRAMELSELADYAVKFVREEENHLGEEDIDNILELLADNGGLGKTLTKDAYHTGLKTPKNIPIPYSPTAAQISEIAHSGNHLSQKQADFLAEYYLPYAQHMHTALDYEQGLTQNSIDKKLHDDYMVKQASIKDKYLAGMPRPTLRNTPPKEKAQNQLHNEMLADIFPVDDNLQPIDLSIEEREYKLSKWQRTFQSPDYQVPAHLNTEDLAQAVREQQHYIELKKAQPVHETSNQPQQHTQSMHR